MPTNRSRRTRAPRPDVPAWAIRLRDHGEAPDRDSPDREAFDEYYFFHDEVPGLPDRHTREAMLMCNEALRRAD